MVKLSNPVFEKFAVGRTGVPVWGFIVLASSHRGPWGSGVDSIFRKK
jgi:hypothetical protein